MNKLTSYNRLEFNKMMQKYNIGTTKGSCLGIVSKNDADEIIKQLNKTLEDTKKQLTTKQQEIDKIKIKMKEIDDLYKKKYTENNKNFNTEIKGIFNSVKIDNIDENKLKKIISTLGEQTNEKTKNYLLKNKEFLNNRNQDIKNSKKIIDNLNKEIENTKKKLLHFINLDKPINIKISEKTGGFFSSSVEYRDDIITSAVPNDGLLNLSSGKKIYLKDVCADDNLLEELKNKQIGGLNSNLIFLGANEDKNYGVTSNKNQYEIPLMTENYNV